MDKSLTFGTPDYSAQVAQMKDKKVDLVITCIDGNGAATLAREMKKQGLNVPQILPNSYNQDLIKKNAQVLNGELPLHDLHAVRDEPGAAGPQELPEVDQEERRGEDRELAAGWINADEFVTGLKAAGPNFTRQKVVDATNKITNYTAGGIVAPINWTTAHQNHIDCYAVAEGRQRQVQAAVRQEGQAVPVLPRRAEDDAQAAAGQRLTQRGPEGRRSPKE